MKRQKARDEAQRAKNKQLLQETLTLLVQEMCQPLEDERDYHICCAWFLGAAILAKNLVNEVESIRLAWAEGDKEKALALCEVCVQPMISIWRRNVDRQEVRHEKAKREAKEIAITHILNTLGTYSKKKLRDYLNLDLQYNYEESLVKASEETAEWSISWYAALLVSKAKEACGIQGFIDWDAQTFPIRQSRDLKLVEGFEKDIPGIFDTRLIITYTGIKMFDYFKKEMKVE